MITLDASVVIAHLDSQDPHHEAATGILRESVGKGFIIHSLNLAEVLVGGVGVGRDQEILTDLEAIGIRVADRHDGEALRLANLRVTSGLKLPDCCALDTALTSSSTLATFDRVLTKVARRHHVTVAPDGANTCLMQRRVNSSGVDPGVRISVANSTANPFGGTYDAKLLKTA